jgi:hypothetical protein
MKERGESKRERTGDRDNLKIQNAITTTKRQNKGLEIGLKAIKES